MIKFIKKILLENLQLILIIEVADEYSDVSVSYILNELQEDFDNQKDDLEFGEVAKLKVTEIKHPEWLV